MFRRPQAVVVALSDGLGNQLFQYAAARAISLRAGIPLYLDLQNFELGDGYRQYMLGAFRIVEQFADDALRRAFLGPRSTAQTRWWPQRLLDSLRPAHRRFCHWQTEWRFYPELLAVRCGCYLRGYWQSERYFADVADVLRSELVLRQLPQGNAAAVVRQIAACPNSAALHVRRGDYLAPHTAGIHGVCGIEYYRAAVQHVRRTAGDVRWWIFSDDLQWVRREPFLSSLGQVVESDVQDPLGDFLAMRCCRHFVIANSTFSWWAAWLGERQGSVVVAPQRWFLDPTRDAKDVVPKRWVQL